MAGLGVVSMLEESDESSRWMGMRGRRQGISCGIVEEESEVDESLDDSARVPL